MTYLERLKALRAANIVPFRSRAELNQQIRARLAKQRAGSPKRSIKELAMAVLERNKQANGGDHGR